MTVQSALSGRYLHRSYQDILRKELTFPSITETHNLDYAHKITTSHSIGVHIRRGDYVTLGWHLGNNYYLENMTALTRKYPESSFFIFSDDLDWCRLNAHELGFDLSDNIIYVEGNINGQNYRDMQLMSMCKGLLMSNSAFCYLAALLNTDLKICLQPPVG